MKLQLNMGMSLEQHFLLRPSWSVPFPEYRDSLKTLPGFPWTWATRHRGDQPGLETRPVRTCLSTSEMTKPILMIADSFSSSESAALKWDFLKCVPLSWLWEMPIFTGCNLRATVAFSCRTAQSLYYANMLCEFQGGQKQCSILQTHLTRNILFVLCFPLLFAKCHHQVENSFGSHCFRIPVSLQVCAWCIQHPYFDISTKQTLKSLTT